MTAHAALNWTSGASASAIVEAGLATIPVDIARIADDLGLQVQYRFDLPEGISGKIYRCSNARAGYCLEVNGTQSAARQRFTLAHEIAHYVLHRDLIGDGVTDDALYRSTLTSYLEAQANRYAAEMLLPERAVRSAFRADPSPSALAEQFNVSTDALRIRIKQLALIP